MARRKSEQPEPPRIEPKPRRPHMADYGIPTSKKGLLPWSHVTERMDSAHHYWICTVSSDGRPHATPVDGLWIDDQLYFGGSPKTRRHRNLAENSAACVHLESAMDVVILHGDATKLRAPDQSLAVRLAAESAKKYGYAPTPEQLTANGVYVFRPRWALAWKQFPKDVTRWDVENG